MGTKVSEDLRKGYSDYKDPSEMSWGEWLKRPFTDKDHWRRKGKQLKRWGEAAYDWKENLGDYYGDYGSIQEQEMRDQSWGDWYSPREFIYDKTGYDYGGKLKDLTAAAVLNPIAHTIDFTSAGLAAIPQFYKGKGKGLGSLIMDPAARWVTGKPLYENNPLYDIQGQQKIYGDILNDVMDKDSIGNFVSEKEIDKITKKTQDLVDYYAFMDQNPGAEYEDYEEAYANAWDNFFFEKHGEEIFNEVDKRYKEKMIDEWGIYNPGLLQGTSMEKMSEDEAYKEFMNDIDLGAFNDLKNSMTRWGTNKWFPYTSRKAQDLYEPIEFVGDIAAGFGVPGAFRAGISHAGKHGMSKTMQRAIYEALPGTTTPFGKGSSTIKTGLPRFKEKGWKTKWLLNKPIGAIDASRHYGSQYAAPIIIGEKLFGER
tara:strand:- start:13 stop:1287 length:1275 start_codon:yes stop_codon:yes gene_type:complete